MDPRVADLPKNRSEPKKKPNYCPYGCTLAQHDENGYCRHLIGWTNDGEKIEVRHFHPETKAELQTRHDSENPAHFRLPGDIIVETNSTSSRVYRGEKGDVLVGFGGGRSEDNAALDLLGEQQQEIAALREEKAEQKKRLDELEAKFEKLLADK